MQLNQPDRKVIAKPPRHSRRGALMPAALLGVLLITLVLSQFASAQLRHASAARSEARAVWLAAIAADFDYYVHKNRETLKEGLTEDGRALNDTEQTTFKQYFLRVGLAPKMPGVTVDYLILRWPDDDDVFGALRLSATDGLDAELQTTMARLARYGAEAPVQGILDLPDISAANGSASLILTAPLSGIDSKYVLRMRRAGHPEANTMKTDLDMGGCKLAGEARKCDLLNVGSLTALGGAKSAAETVRGPDPANVARLYARDMTGTLQSVGKTPETPDTGNVGIGGTTYVGKTLTVKNPVVTGECTGC